MLLASRGTTWGARGRRLATGVDSSLDASGDLAFLDLLVLRGEISEKFEPRDGFFRRAVVVRLGLSSDLSLGAKGRVVAVFMLRTDLKDVDFGANSCRSNGEKNMFRPLEQMPVGQTGE